jgi:hypothetical protein
MVHGCPRFLYQNKAATKSGSLVAHGVSLSLPRSSNGEDPHLVLFLQQKPDQMLPSALLLLLLASISPERQRKIAPNNSFRVLGFNLLRMKFGEKFRTIYKDFGT